MGLYNFLVTTYNNFLAYFPPTWHWVVTLAIILILVTGFVSLVRRNVLFVLLLIPLAPILLPPVVSLCQDMGAFFLYLLHSSGSQAPHA